MGFKSGGSRPYHNPENSKDMRQLYHRFHHGDSEVELQAEVPETPLELYVIGRIPEIRYIPMGSTKKPKEVHVHTFGDNGFRTKNDVSHMPLLCADKDDNLWIVRNGTPHYIDERGIID